MILLETLNNKIIGDMARQAVINGNFEVYQRGFTFSNPANATYTADRWKTGTSADGGTLPGFSLTGLGTGGYVPQSFSYFRYATSGLGVSLGNNAVIGIQQWIEHGTRFLCGAGKTVTVSFYARAFTNGAARKLGVRLIQNYGSGGSPTAQEEIAGQVITLTTTWTRYSLVFTTNTLVGKTFGTAGDDALRLLFEYYWGSTRATNNYGGVTTPALTADESDIDITQVQLSVGSKAIAFSPRSFDEELKLCQRYFEKSFDYLIAPAVNCGSTNGAAYYGAQVTWLYHVFPTVYYKVRKRVTVTPTIYAYNNATLNRITDHNNGAIAFPPGFLGLGQSSFTAWINGNASGLAWYCFHWTADAEM